jgi:hypothetical protein
MTTPTDPDRDTTDIEDEIREGVGPLPGDPEMDPGADGELGLRDNDELTTGDASMNADRG